MRFLRFQRDGKTGLAVANGSVFHGLLSDDSDYPGDLALLISSGSAKLQSAAKILIAGSKIDEAAIVYLPPFPTPPKIICLGLNYKDHAAESGFQVPAYPTLFGRFSSSLIGHLAPIIRPTVSNDLDYEGELVAVIGTGGRHIAKADALSHIAGYSIFNDGSVRDYQMKTPQWTVGKNFDDTGAFGPYFVTADELPPGAAGLHIETRLNGQIVQSASTSDMVFDVATTISLLSEALTLEAGDVLVMGTPSGIGLARKPPLFMKPGDICEVEIEKLGILRNPIRQEST
jgi:2-keto-4-pentenoate hydratase/2-oxohepta-3-ene-1,7-dioic acid hydratase in catechol pathway